MNHIQQFSRRASCGYIQQRRNTSGIIFQSDRITTTRKTSVPATLRSQSHGQSLPSQQQQANSQTQTNMSHTKCQTRPKATSKECADFDDVIDQLGSNGKYQRFLLYLVVSPLSALQPIVVFNAVFMLFTPEHWCAGPDRPSWNDPEEYKLANIPMVNGTDGIWKYSSCTIYDTNSSGSISKAKCTYGWEYDKTHYERTMTSDNDWVCDKSKIPTYALLSQTVGNAVGTLAFGLLSDAWGRKSTFFLALLISVVFRILSLFTGSNWYFLCITQFCVGLTHTTIYILPSLIAAELCERDQRAEVYATTWTVCLVGLAILPMISWLCGNWFVIGLVTAGLGALCLFFYPAIPESPRWLLQQGKVAEAATILKKVQDYNNGKKSKKLSGEVSSASTSDNFEKLHGQLQVLHRQQLSRENTSDSDGKEVKKSKMLLVFTKRNLMKNILLLTVCWSMNTLIYSTMTYNVMHMKGSHFKNFFLLAIVEAPSGFFGGYLADTLGRRWTQVLAFFFGALGCFATSMTVHQREMEILMAIVAKLSVTVSFLTTYLQATELFPTELRSTGSGMISTISNCVGICAPVVATLSSQNAAYPWFTIGGLSVIGMMAALFLPETLHLTLPETIDDANNIGKKTKFWSVATPPDSLKSNKPNCGEK